MRAILLWMWPSAVDLRRMLTRRVRSGGATSCLWIPAPNSESVVRGRRVRDSQLAINDRAAQDLHAAERVARVLIYEGGEKKLGSNKLA
jgi:hypothetical protein